jgi:hypothetical protein
VAGGVDDGAVVKQRAQLRARLLALIVLHGEEGTAVRAAPHLMGVLKRGRSAHPIDPDGAEAERLKGRRELGHMERLAPLLFVSAHVSDCADVPDDGHVERVVHGPIIGGRDATLA